MKNTFKIILVSIINLLIIVSSVYAKDYTGKVLSNHDGDTLTVTINDKKEKVRLLGVDTAEMAQGYWGKEAQKFTEKLTKGKEVKLETDIQERDKYGRLLAYVYIDGVSLNEELLKEGYAQLLTYSPNVKYVDKFKDLQSNARNSNKGIWSSSNGLKESPYEFRHKGGNKSNKTSKSKSANNIVKPKNVKSSNNTQLVHVNSKSGVYHYSGCQYYDCKNCIIELTEEEAIKQGYRHCKKE